MVGLRGQSALSRRQRQQTTGLPPNQPRLSRATNPRRPPFRWNQESHCSRPLLPPPKRQPPTIRKVLPHAALGGSSVPTISRVRPRKSFPGARDVLGSMSRRTPERAGYGRVRTADSPVFVSCPLRSGKVNFHSSDSQNSADTTYIRDREGGITSRSSRFRIEVMVRRRNDVS